MYWKKSEYPVVKSDNVLRWLTIGVNASVHKCIFLIYFLKVDGPYTYDTNASDSVNVN